MEPSEEKQGKAKTFGWDAGRCGMGLRVRHGLQIPLVGRSYLTVRASQARDDLTSKVTVANPQTLFSPQNRDRFTEAPIQRRLSNSC